MGHRDLCKRNRITLDKHKCKSCGERIINRQLNARHCKECEKPKSYIRIRIGGVKRIFKKNYPDYELKITYKIKKKL